MKNRNMRSNPSSIEAQGVLNQFRRILTANNRVVEKFGQLEQAMGGEFIFDQAFLINSVKELITLVRQIINNLNILSEQHYADLWQPYTTISNRISDIVGGGPGSFDRHLVLPYHLVHRDLDYLIGLKNAALGEIQNELKIAIPDGFAITKNGYLLCLEQNNGQQQIDDILSSQVTAEEKAEAIRLLLQSLKIPDLLVHSIQESLKQLVSSNPNVSSLAVRSSGIGEDGDRSFAGQFKSILNVSPTIGGVLAAYQEVILSRFSPHVIDYLGQGANTGVLPMAVAVQVMISADSGGVIYTVDPESPDNDQLLISAVPGCTESLVSGRVQPDHYRMHRIHQSRILSSEIQNHPKIAAKKESTKVSGKLLRGSALLTPSQLQQLTEIALLLEKTFYHPQDVEWAMADNSITILQSRPLRFSIPPPPPAEEVLNELKEATVLMQGRGQVVQLGTQSGIVVHVSADTNASEFPAGSIAVSHWSGPELSPIVKKAAAVITDVGSPTGHLATIAREYNTPALFGTETGTKKLAEGQTITIDVENRTIYQGTVKSLIKRVQREDDVLHQSDELRNLRRILRWVAPLNLTDSRSDAFKAENCKTFHDIIRFCHEKAVSTIIDLNSQFKKRFKLHKYHLVDKAPFQMKIIDLGEGIDGPASQEITASQIQSAPFTALLAGLSNQQVWSTDPIPFGLKDLFSSLSKPMNRHTDHPEYQGENLALIARDYCNLSLRLGYHFNVIDSYLSSFSENNYIYFRFVGGFSEVAKRKRRVDFINLVLKSLRFKTERKGDLIVGKIKMLDSDEMHSTLKRLGELAAFSRQLDVKMKTEETVDALFTEFIEKSPTNEDQST